MEKAAAAMGISDRSLPIAFYRNSLVLAHYQLKGRNGQGWGAFVFKLPVKYRVNISNYY